MFQKSCFYSLTKNIWTMFKRQILADGQQNHFSSANSALTFLAELNEKKLLTPIQHIFCESLFKVIQSIFLMQEDYEDGYIC